MTTVQTPTVLKTNYINHIKMNKSTRSSKQVEDYITLATYNVHYWTDVYENDKLNDIVNDIHDINADLIVLQEVALGKFILEGKPEINGSLAGEMFNAIGLKKQIFCNTVPSWWNIPYGNLMLIHKDLLGKLKCNDAICSVLHETNYTFNKSTSTVVVSGSHQGTAETRCYIKVVFPKILENKDVVVYGTHLDVASEQTRTNQIQQIIEDAERSHKEQCIVIMGDFNTIDREQYVNDTQILENLESIGQTEFSVITTLKEHGFNDAFTVANIVPPKMTTWNNTRVDFVFVQNIEKRHIADIHAYYTDNSDHLPIVLKLKIPATGAKGGQGQKKRTDKKLYFKGRSRTIFKGTRGGEYIKLGGVFINVRSL